MPDTKNSSRTSNPETDAARWRWFREHWAQVVFHTDSWDGQTFAKEIALNMRFNAGDAESFERAVDAAMELST